MTWQRTLVQPNKNAAVGRGPRDQFRVSDSKWRSAWIANTHHIEFLVFRGIVLSDGGPERAVAQILVEE